jgi:calcineurin-like phosphoesterase family protein
MNYWIISDTHLGHDKMEEFCGRPKGFEDVILHSLSTIPVAADLNSVLIHLGDICIGDDNKWNSEIVNAIQCNHKWLIRGNHDKKSMAWYLERGWDFVADSFTMDIFGGDILFSHTPKIDTGYMLNIHGHFHNSDHHRHEPELVKIKNARQVLIAIEYSNYAAVNLQSLVKKLARPAPKSAPENTSEARFIDSQQAKECKPV